MTDTQISTAGDFPNLAVYERPGAAGKVYSIVFDNPEFGGWTRGLFGLIGLFLAIPFAVLTIAIAVQVGEEHGALWGFGALGVGVAIAVACIVWLTSPWKRRVAIEIDLGNPELRVFRQGRLQVARPLSPDMALTVEDHPDAEYKRMVRQEERRTTLSEAERQHCLIGWFGAKGAEKVVLVTRAEWPCHESLYEVRQAILWALQRAGGADTPELVNEARGINPPLD